MLFEKRIIQGMYGRKDRKVAFLKILRKGYDLGYGKTSKGIISYKRLNFIIYQNGIKFYYLSKWDGLLC